MLTDLTYIPNALSFHAPTSHLGLCGSISDQPLLSIYNYTPPSSPASPPALFSKSLSAYSTTRLSGSHINNAICLTNQLRSTTTWGGPLKALLSNNDGTLRVVGFHERRSWDRDAAATLDRGPEDFGRNRRWHGEDGRKAVEIGRGIFETSINSSSISPDGRTILSVGDTNEVFLVRLIVIPV